MISKPPADCAHVEHALALGAVRDGASITADWELRQPALDGVLLRPIRAVPKDNGRLVEIWRRDWNLDALPVEQVFANLINPGQVSGWHMHAQTTDRIFVCLGTLKIVLWDGRPGSPSYQQSSVHFLGIPRPGLLLIPPGVWHAVRNTTAEPAMLLNIVDRAYDYDAPDHYRLPGDTEAIPLRP